MTLKRVQWRKMMMLSLLLLALSACGGGPAGDINIGEGTFIETQYVSPLPDSEALSVNVDDLEDASFRYTVSGAAEEVVTGEGTFAEISEQGWFVGLSKRDPDDGHVMSGVSFTMPFGTEAGTYRVFPQRQAYNLLQEVVGIGGMFFDDRAEADSAIPFRTFDNVTEGKITFTTIEPLTGAFEFTANSPSGNRVTVSGVFKTLPKSLTQPTD